MEEELFLQMLRISVTMIPVILLLKLLGSRLQKVYAARWKYYLWLVLAMRLLLPWSPTFTVQPVEITLPENTGVEYEAPQYDAGEKNLMVENLATEQKQWGLEKVEAQTPKLPEKTWRLSDILALAETAWIMVAVFYLGYHMVAHLYAERSLRRWSRPADEVLLKNVKGALGEDQIPKRLALLVSTRITSPMVTGLFAPKLYLPERGYESRELRFMLQHELVHYRRKDLWYKALLLVVNSVHWFNPFVYLMCKEAEKDLECSCDSVVMAGAGKKMRCSYAHLILDTADGSVDKRLLTSNFHGGAEDMKRRLQNIMDNGKKKKGIAMFALVIATSVGLGGLVGVKMGESNASQITAQETVKQEVQDVQKMLEMLEGEAVTEKTTPQKDIPAETKPPADKQFESPVTFLDENLIQTADKSQNKVHVSLGSDMQWLSAYKKEGVEHLFYQLEYGDDVHYEIKDGALRCQVGLYQGGYFYRGVAELTYIYENGVYVVDRKHAHLIIDWWADTEARNSLWLYSRIMEECDGLLLHENSSCEDRLTLHRVVDKKEAYNVLTVYLDNGLVTSCRLPSNNVVMNDISHIYRLPMQSDFYQTIVVTLTDPNLENTDESTDYYVLHVEVDEACSEAEIVLDAVILDNMTDAENYEAYKEKYLEMPFYHVIADMESGPYYHEELGVITFKIVGMPYDRKIEQCAYVYWDGESWKTYFE